MQFLQKLHENNLGSLLVVKRLKMISWPQIEELNLSKMGLERVPPFVMHLEGLRRLHLNGNNIKVLPTFIQNMSKLQYLDISRNQIFGAYEVPESLRLLECDDRGQHVRPSAATINRIPRKYSAEEVEMIAEAERRYFDEWKTGADPVKKLKELELEQQDDDCALCLEPLKDGAVVECAKRHQIHEDCYRQLMATDYGGECIYRCETFFRYKQKKEVAREVSCAICCKEGGDLEQCCRLHSIHMSCLDALQSSTDKSRLNTRKFKKMLAPPKEHVPKSDPKSKLKKRLQELKQLRSGK